MKPEKSWCLKVPLKILKHRSPFLVIAAVKLSDDGNLSFLLILNGYPLSAHP